MLTSEHKKVYSRKIGSTEYTITSECPQETNADMLDAIIELAKDELERPLGWEKVSTE